MYINRSLRVILQLFARRYKEATVVWSGYTKLECFRGVKYCSAALFTFPWAAETKH